MFRVPSGSTFRSGLCVCLGVALSPLYALSDGPALTAALIFFGVATWWSGRMGEPIWQLLCYLSFFFLGIARGSLEPELPIPRSIHGEVLSRRGPEGRVSGPQGDFTLRFPWPGPHPGAHIAAWTTPLAAAPLLPDQLDPALADRLARRPRAQVLRWVPLATGAPEPTLPEVYAGLEHGGLLQALVVGDRQHLSDGTAQILAATGTTHMLSVSGLHITLLFGLGAATTTTLMRPLSLKRQRTNLRNVPLIGGLIATWAFGHLVGLPLPVQRSLGMVTWATVGTLLGRRQGAMSSLGASAAGVCLFDPGAVAEPSAWLSFGAVLGMMSVPHHLLRYLPPDLPPGLHSLASALATTLGATIGTLPATVLIFQEVPLSSPLGNLWAGPPMSGLVLPLAAIARVLPLELGRPLALLADLTAAGILEVMALFPKGVLRPAAGVGGALTLTVALFFFRRHPYEACLLASFGLFLKPIPTTELEIQFLDIGQGDAALVRWPDGRRHLIDGGPPGDALERYLRASENYPLDAIYLSHPHPDHLGGLIPVLETLPVGTIYVPRLPEPDEAEFLAFYQLAAAHGVPVRVPTEVPEPGIRVVHPHDFRTTGSARVNDESLVLQIHHGDHTFLFAGDIEAKGERHLRERLGPVDVLKVAHHGSRTSSDPALIAVLQPEVAVISCGRANRYGHPHPETWAHLAGHPVFRTDVDGNIRVFSDGTTLRWSHQTVGQGWQPLYRTPFKPLPPPGWSPDQASADAADGNPPDGHHANTRSKHKAAAHQKAKRPKKKKAKKKGAKKAKRSKKGKGSTKRSANPPSVPPNSGGAAPGP